jgi:antitoxin MazE
VLRKPSRTPREGWLQAAKQIAAQGDDELVLGDFPNEADAEWEW